MQAEKMQASIFFTIHKQGASCGGVTYIRRLFKGVVVNIRCFCGKNKEAFALSYSSSTNKWEADIVLV